jgi:hypothetical protein
MEGRGRRRGSLGRAGWLATLVVGLGLLPVGNVLAGTPLQDALIPVLGTTMDQHPVGQVVYLGLSFENRKDEAGLAVVFKSAPGRFSRMTQTAVEEAIYRAARAMDVSPHSWTVFLSLPYPGVTLYGESQGRSHPVGPRHHRHRHARWAHRSGRRRLLESRRSQ